jgi:hypothetical protein
MPRDEKEPQSYGGQGGWVSGGTGQNLNGSGDRTDVQHDDFYAPRRETEVNVPPLGGGPQPAWTDHVDVLQPVSTVTEVEDPARKVTAEKGGARREGFFKSRDYQ